MFKGHFELKYTPLKYLHPKHRSWRKREFRSSNKKNVPSPLDLNRIRACWYVLSMLGLSILRVLGKSAYKCILISSFLGAICKADPACQSLSICILHLRRSARFWLFVSFLFAKRKVRIDWLFTLTASLSFFLLSLSFFLPKSAAPAHLWLASIGGIPSQPILRAPYGSCLHNGIERASEGRRRRREREEREKPGFNEER